MYQPAKTIYISDSICINLPKQYTYLILYGKVDTYRIRYVNCFSRLIHVESDMYTVWQVDISDSICFNLPNSIHIWFYMYQPAKQYTYLILHVSTCQNNLHIWFYMYQPAKTTYISDSICINLDTCRIRYVYCFGRLIHIESDMYIVLAGWYM
jgi:hypothetical protein